MSSGNEIPWSSKPKNGIKSFFTEETFNKWIGQNTHESRMEERLYNVGISLCSRSSGPFFMTTPKPECKFDEKIDSRIRCSLSTSTADSGASASKTGVKEKSSAQQFQFNSTSIQVDKSLEKVGSFGEPDKQLQKLGTSSSDSTGTINAETSLYTDNIEGISGKEPEYFCKTDANATGERVDSQGRNIVTCRKEISKTSVSDQHVTGQVGLERQELLKSVLEIKHIETESVRPVSFYKECSEEKPPAEISDEENSKRLVTTYEVPKNTEPSGHDTRGQANNRTILESTKLARQEETEQFGSEVLDSEKSEESREEEVARQDEQARKMQKQLLVQDKMFFNLKDRTAEKYFPDVFKKRPKNRRSKLTCQEQKLFIDLVRRFGNVDANTPEINDENFKKYLEMKVTVSKEQELFQSYLKSISHTCKKDYEYIHPEVEKYATARYLVKKNECFKYPRFYNSVSKMDLTDVLPENPPTLQYIKPLLELGLVSKLVLPSVLPGMPQPCVATSFKKINDICPILKGEYKGTYVWNKVVCSQDPNAEQLAVPNKCDIVMSSSAIKHLVDNQGRIFKYWDMPFTVREYKINEAEKITIHKVIYIDKPFIRQSQYVPKDHIQLYQKHAIRACAIRNNVRGHVFCGIKPVNELVKMPTLEELQHEVNDYERKLKETINKDQDFDSEGESADSKFLKNKKRKHGQIGVFDLEKDIDDLETFGMDSFFVSKDRSGVSSEKLKSPNEKTDAFGAVVKKGRKSAKDDLESLKNELECIKTQAIKESFRHTEKLKDTFSKEDGKGTKAPISNITAEVEEMYSDCGFSQETSRNTRHEGKDTMSVLQEEKNTANISPENTWLKEIDNELVLQNKKNTTDVSTDTRKKDILNVKSMSSLSEKMKQMSSIKSKLIQRMTEQDLTSHAQSSDIAGDAQFGSSEDRAWSGKSSRDTYSVTKSSTVNNMEGTGGDDTEAVQKLIENAPDSDSEEENLIIDVLSESPTVHTGSIKPVGNTRFENTKMLTLKKVTNYVTNKMASKEKTEAELKNICDTDTTIKRESEKLDTSSSMIAEDEVEETTGKEKIRDGKRRSSAEVAEDVSVPKRILRSAANRKTDTDMTRSIQSTAQMSDTIKSDNLSDHSNQQSVISSDDGERKLENGNFCVTKRASTSSESGGQFQGTSTINQAKPDSELVPAESESVHVKRGRGRPRKMLTKFEKNLNKSEKVRLEQENDKPKTSKNVSDKQSFAQIQDDFVNYENQSKSKDSVDTKMHTLECKEEHPEKKDPNPDTNCDEEFPCRRIRSNVRRIDSDDEIGENSRLRCDEMHHEKNKDKKKDWSEFEARKIKEMADAMKKRIEETKKIIREEKCIKNKQSRESKRENSSEKVSVSQKMDHSQDPAAADSKSSHNSEVTLKSEEKTDMEKGLDKKLESILKLQDKMYGPCVNKGSLAEVFTQRHGMTHCGFPVDGNVTYHQWNLSGISVLIRSKYHGFISGQGLVHISPKIEYQPNFGFEQDSVSEMCKNWISVYIRPNSSLLKPRINPFNSEIMMFDYIAYKDLVPPDSLFKPTQAFTDLHAILDNLKSLPVGQYLLKNNPRKDQFTVLKATEQEERGSFDLHLNHSSFIKCNSPPSIQWTPLDTTLMLPHQRKMNFIPCTYQPKDAKVGEKKQEKRKKKRKNRDK